MITTARVVDINLNSNSALFNTSFTKSFTC
jgi:hypothetical protein